MFTSPLSLGVSPLLSFSGSHACIKHPDFPFWTCTQGRASPGVARGGAGWPTSPSFPFAQDLPHLHDFLCWAQLALLPVGAPLTLPSQVPLLVRNKEMGQPGLLGAARCEFVPVGTVQLYTTETHWFATWLSVLAEQAVCASVLQPA